LVAQNRISAVVSSTDLERSRGFYEKKGLLHDEGG